MKQNESKSNGMIRQKWTVLKNIIGSYENRDGLFLSLMHEDGNILCANATMLKELHLKPATIKQINFFDLLAPGKK